MISTALPLDPTCVMICVLCFFMMAIVPLCFLIICFLLGWHSIDRINDHLSADAPIWKRIDKAMSRRKK